MKANKLRLNPDKTERLLVNGKAFVCPGGDCTLPERSISHSGVLLDSGPYLMLQTSSVVHNIFYQLWLIHKQWPFLKGGIWPCDPGFDHI